MHIDPLNAPDAPTPSGASREQQHEQKLQRTGEQVARIAHELNKAVSLVSGSLENLEEQVGVLLAALDTRGASDHQDERRVRYAGDNAPALVSICRQGAQRLTSLVDQLKTFTRTNGGAQWQEVDVQRAVETALAWATHGRALVPETVCNVPTLPPVCGDPEPLTEALVNVIGNAFDALEPVDGARLEITATLASSAGGHGDTIELRIRDNGPGIPHEDREHIFTPFFTSKPAATGLGLGLAIVRDTIEGLSGTIEARDNEGGGADFVIRLPTVDPKRSCVDPPGGSR